MSEIICPICSKKLENTSTTDLYYSDHEFSIVCDRCNETFSCKPYVQFVFYPTGVYIKSENGKLVDVSDKIVKELEKGENLCEYPEDKELVFSLYKVKEVTFCYDNVALEDDYIMAPYSYGGRLRKINKWDLSVASRKYRELFKEEQK